MAPTRRRTAAAAAVAVAASAGGGNKETATTGKPWWTQGDATFTGMAQAMAGVGEAAWSPTAAGKDEMLAAVAEMIQRAEQFLPVAVDEADSNETKAATELYQEVTKGVQVYINHPNSLHAQTPMGLFHIIESFHSCLLKFEHSATRHLVPGMVASCEAWFLAQAPQHELVAPQTISYLLLQSLQENSKAIDIRRVFVMRRALQLLDFADPSSLSLKNLILHTFMHPQYLTTLDGRKFLVFCLGLHLPMIDQIYTTIRNQIPNASKTTLDTFGDILFRAWKGAEGPFVHKLEYDCIQDLMNHAVHANTMQLGGLTMAMRLRKILNAFHTNKTQPGVDQMLFRLYEPILWRALKVANITVRRNAATIMIDAFPLREPDAPQADIDDQMQRQFDTLADLLNDDSPAVRQVGIEGVCRVLAVFWELIPVVVIVDFLKKLTEQLAYDVTDVGVRAAVVVGLHYIVSNAPLSHASLKAPLQRLGPLLHDNSERVRIVMADLLLAIKSVPDVKFWDIVDIPHILAQLTKDGPKVSKRLVTLLVNSFFPQHKSVQVQTERVKVLLEKNRSAARVFFFYLPRCVGVDATLPLIQELYVIAYDSLTAGAENKAVRKNMVDLNEVDLAEEFLEIAALMLDSGISASSQKKDKKRAKAIATIFQSRPLDVLNTDGICGTISSKSALHILACHTPSSAVPQIAKSCLTSLVGKTTKPLASEIPSLIKSVQSWGQTSQVLATAIKWLQQSPLGVFSSKSATGKRRPEIELINPIESQRALDLIDALMSVKESREMLLSDKATMTPLTDLLAAAWPLLDEVISQAQFDNEDLVAFVEHAITVAVKLDVHQWASQEELTHPPTMVDLVLETLSKHLSTLLVSNSDEATEATNRVSRKRKQTVQKEKSATLVRLLSPLLKISVEYCMLGASSLAQTNTCVQAFQLLVTLVKKEGYVDFLPLAKKLMSQGTQLAALAPSDASVEPLFMQLSTALGMLSLSVQ